MRSMYILFCLPITPDWIIWDHKFEPSVFLLIWVAVRVWDLNFHHMVDRTVGVTWSENWYVDIDAGNLQVWSLNVKTCGWTYFQPFWYLAVENWDWTAMSYARWRWFLITQLAHLVCLKQSEGLLFHADQGDCYRTLVCMQKHLRLDWNLPWGRKVNNTWEPC